MMRRFRLRHDPSRLMLLAGIGVAVLAALLTVPAIADSGDGAGALAPLNGADSRGIHVNQYELSIPAGHPVTSPQQMVLSMIFSLGWDAFRWWIGLLAYLVDWTLGMEWVTWLAGPLNSGAAHIRTAIFEPLGATGLGQGGLITLFLVIAGCVGAFHISRGRVSGWFEIFMSAFIAGVAVTLLAAPVVTLAGNDVEPATPLRYAQRIGIELGNAATTGKVSTAPIDGGGGTVSSDDVPGAEAGEAATVDPPMPGKFLLDTFIRPVHQSLNYGTVLDTTDKACAEVYDETLKAGPHEDPDTARKAVGECNAAYKVYSGRTTTGNIITLAIFSIAAVLIGVVVLVFTVFLWLGILNLVWAAFRMLFTVLLAIPPGATRGPLIRDMINVAISLLYVATGIPLFVVLVDAVKGILKANAAVPLLARFLLVDLVLVAAIALIIINYVQHRKGARSLSERLTAKLRQHGPRADPGARAGQWLKSPARGAQEVGTGGGNPALAAGGAGGGGMVRRVASSNGAQFLAKGAQIGATVAGGVATGGAGAVVKGVVATRKITRNASRAGKVMKAVRSGSKNATTGTGWLDRVLIGRRRKGEPQRDQSPEQGPTPDSNPPEDSPSTSDAQREQTQYNPGGAGPMNGGGAARGETGQEDEPSTSSEPSPPGPTQPEQPRPDPSSPEGLRREHQRLRVRVELAQRTKESALQRAKQARIERSEGVSRSTQALHKHTQLHRDFYKGKGARAALSAAEAELRTVRGLTQTASAKVRDVEGVLKDAQAATVQAITAEQMFRPKVVRL